MLKKISFLVILVTVLAFPLSVLAAQNTLTVTESQINGAYRVSNPARRTVSEVFVDLQDGQATITGTVTLRGKQPASVHVVVVPKLVTSGSRTLIDWTVTSFTVNGKAGSGEYIEARNAFTSALRRAISSQLGRRYSVQSVVIADDTITVTYTH